MTKRHEADADAGFEVTRFISVPKSVSAEAQQFLSMDLSAISTIEDLDPTDKDGWRAQFAATNEMLAVVLESLATVPVEVETISVEGVPVFVVVPEAIAAEG